MKGFFVGLTLIWGGVTLILAFAGLPWQLLLAASMCMVGVLVMLKPWS